MRKQLKRGSNVNAGLNGKSAMGNVRIQKKSEMKGIK